MAEKGGHRRRRLLVPLREEDGAVGDHVSESQERMLCVVTPEQLDAVLAVCAHREAGYGHRRGDRPGRLRVLDGGPVVGDLPVEVVDCPL
jgi:phosphoribosylformylglycinamidine synthase